jgi:LCP family protein required for cell wall assembly
VSIETPPAPRPSSTGQRATIAVAILIFAAVSAYLALVIITRVDSIFFPGNELKLNTIPGGAVLEPLPGVDTEGTSGSQERINILVLGLDRRPQEGDIPSRTDTVFVVTIDPKTKSAGILGIPRDGLVDIPLEGGGTRSDSINVVYVEGETNDYPGGGLGLLEDVMQTNFGIEIHHHVLVDFEGFEQIVDALGGVDVDVPDYVYDPYYSWTELPGDYDPQEFEPGRQHMDGRTALAYSRIRFSSDDLDRIQRQQRVIFAAIEKGKSLDVTDAGRARDLWSKYNDAIQTDISDALIPGYAVLASQAQDNILAVSLGDASVPFTGRGGRAYQAFDWDTVEELVTALFEDRVPETDSSDLEPVRVQIQNGAGIDRLAANVAAYIASNGGGFRVEDLTVGDAYDGAEHDTSVVLDLSDTHERRRLQLASMLGIDPANARAATATELTEIGAVDAEIIVVLGSDVDYDTLIQSPTTTTPGG